MPGVPCPRVGGGALPKGPAAPHIALGDAVYSASELGRSSGSQDRGRCRPLSPARHPSQLGCLVASVFPRVTWQLAAPAPGPRRARWAVLLGEFSLPAGLCPPGSRRHRCCPGSHRGGGPGRRPGVPVYPDEVNGGPEGSPGEAPGKPQGSPRGSQAWGQRLPGRQCRWEGAAPGRQRFWPSVPAWPAAGRCVGAADISAAASPAAGRPSSGTAGTWLPAVSGARGRAWRRHSTGARGAGGERGRGGTPGVGGSIPQKRPGD